MKRVIRIRTHNVDPEIKITARIDTSGVYLTRDETQEVVESLTDNLVDALRSGISYGSYYASHIQIVK